MSRYYTPSLMVFSILGGVTAYVLLSLFTDNVTSLTFASIATLAIATVIPATLAVSDRRIMPIRKEIGEPILIDERIRIIKGKEAKQGFILATAASLFLVSLDGDRPVKLEIKKDSIRKISINEEVYIDIFIDYSKFIRIFCGNCEELFSRLAEEGFTK